MKKLDVILLYDGDCPNVSKAQANLREAFASVGHIADWRDIDRGAAGTPEQLKGYGSPTILVEGHDVAGQQTSSDGKCCRVYQTPNGLAGVPTVEQISTLLKDEPQKKVKSGRKRFLAVLPAVGVAMVPKIVCPLCWPAYTALLAALGISFLPTVPYLLPVTVACLLLALGVLGWRARRLGMGPLVLGMVAAGIILPGRFAWGWQPALYAGVAVLVAAFVWDTWITRKQPGSCPRCKTAGEKMEVSSS